MYNVLFTNATELYAICHASARDDWKLFYVKEKNKSTRKSTACCKNCIAICSKSKYYIFRIKFISVVKTLLAVRVRLPCRTNRAQCRQRLTTAALPRRQATEMDPPLVTRFGHLIFCIWNLVSKPFLLDDQVNLLDNLTMKQDPAITQNFSLLAG